MKTCVVSITLQIKAFVSTGKQLNPGKLRLPWLEKLSLGEMKNESCWAEDRSESQAKKRITAFTRGCNLLLHSSGLINILNPSDSREI